MRSRVCRDQERAQAVTKITTKKWRSKWLEVKSERKVLTDYSASSQVLSEITQAQVNFVVASTSNDSSIISQYILIAPNIPYTHCKANKNANYH